MLATLAEASKAGSWCAVVGMLDLGYVAVAEYGIVLERLVVIHHPGSRWQDVLAALIDGFDLVVIRSLERLAPGAAQQFAARARKTGAVILPFGQPWDVAETHLAVVESSWYGIGEGAGRKLLVEGRRRGVHDTGRRIEMWLPKPDEHWMPRAADEPRRLRSVG